MAFLTSENEEKETPEDDSALFDTSVEVQEPPEICHPHDSESCTEMPTNDFLLPEEVCDREDDSDSICEVSQMTEKEVSIVNQRPAEDDSLFLPESDSNSSTGFYDSPNSNEGAISSSSCVDSSSESDVEPIAMETSTPTRGQRPGRSRGRERGRGGGRGRGQ